MEVEALIVGFDEKIPHIYEVDKYGSIRCYNDVGFAVIGIGGWHARSRLMQFGYVNTLPYMAALAAIYAAKRAAEIAPGVGKAQTDIKLVFRDTNETLYPHVHAKLKELYERFEKEQTERAIALIAELSQFSYAAKPEVQQPDQVALPASSHDGRADSEASGSGTQESAEHKASEAS